MPCGRFGGGGGHVPLLPPLGSGTEKITAILRPFNSISIKSGDW